MLAIEWFYGLYTQLSIDILIEDLRHISETGATTLLVWTKCGSTGWILEDLGARFCCYSDTVPIGKRMYLWIFHNWNRNTECYAMPHCSVVRFITVLAAITTSILDPVTNIFSWSRQQKQLAFNPVAKKTDINRTRCISRPTGRTIDCAGVNYRYN